MLTLIDGPLFEQNRLLADILACRRKLDGAGESIIHTCAGSRILDQVLTGIKALSAYRTTYVCGTWLGASVSDELSGLEPRVTASQRRILERLALAREAVQVLVVPPEAVCYYRWKLEQALRRRTCTTADEVNFATHYLRFSELAQLASQNKSSVPTLRYDETEQTMDELERLIEARRPARNAGPGVGAWRAGGTLLIGEQVNREDVLGPFCDLGSTGCTHWLHAQLDSVGVSEARLYWINALDQHGSSIDPTFVDQLQPRQIIALGKVAEGWCQTHRLTHVTVPHPQHWKRFHHDERYPLLDLLA